MGQPTAEELARQDWVKHWGPGARSPIFLPPKYDPRANDPSKWGQSRVFQIGELPAPTASAPGDIKSIGDFTPIKPWEPAHVQTALFTFQLLDNTPYANAFLPEWVIQYGNGATRNTIVFDALPAVRMSIPFETLTIGIRLQANSSLNVSQVQFGYVVGKNAIGGRVSGPVSTVPFSGALATTSVLVPLGANRWRAGATTPANYASLFAVGTTFVSCAGRVVGSASLDTALGTDLLQVYQSGGFIPLRNGVQSVQVTTAAPTPAYLLFGLDF